MKQADYSHIQMPSLSINVEKLTLIQTIHLEIDPRVIAMSPDGKLLASIITKEENHTPGYSYDNSKYETKLLVWDVKAGKGEIVNLKESFHIYDIVSCIIFNFNEKALISSRLDSKQNQGIIQAWKVETGELIRVFPSHTYQHSVISANEQVLVGDRKNELEENESISTIRHQWGPPATTTHRWEPDTRTIPDNLTLFLVS